MGGSEDLPDLGADRVVERGERYEHAKHGSVEVTAIWNGVTPIEKAEYMETKRRAIVRYLVSESDERMEELTDTIDEFLSAIR